MACLVHPNVVAAHDIGEYADEFFLAMDGIDGVTLASWVARLRGGREVSRLTPLAWRVEVLESG